MNQYLCMEDGAKEAKSCGGTMPAAEDNGKTMCNASANAWRVTEHSISNILLPHFLSLHCRLFPGKPWADSMVVNLKTQERGALHFHQGFLNGSKPIHGSIPLIFPFFGPPTKLEHFKLSQHSFTRNQVWKFDGTVVDNDTAISMLFGKSLISLEIQYMA